MTDDNGSPRRLTPVLKPEHYDRIKDLHLGQECEVHVLPVEAPRTRHMALSVRDGRGSWKKGKLWAVNVCVQFDDGTHCWVHPSHIGGDVDLRCRLIGAEDENKQQTMQVSRMNCAECAECGECGEEIKLLYNDQVNAELKSRSLCHDCMHWTTVLETWKQHNRVCIKGRVFVAGKAVKDGEGPKGYGGVWFRIRRHGSDTVEDCNNLWHNGEVPAHFRNRIKDDAEFVAGPPCPKCDQPMIYAPHTKAKYFCFVHLSDTFNLEHSE